jgi:hypothetical protein
MRGNEPFARDIISRLHQTYPTWKMNVKYDIDRNKRPKYQQYPPPYPNYPPAYQNYPPIRQPQQQQPYPNYLPPNPPANNPIPSEQIVGNKPSRVLVRELWLGGIPEHYDKAYMAQLMAYYGIVEEIEMFPKFAFVKYKKVEEATKAF